MSTLTSILELICTGATVDLHKPKIRHLRSGGTTGVSEFCKVHRLTSEAARLIRNVGAVCGAFLRIALQQISACAPRSLPPAPCQPSALSQAPRASCSSFQWASSPVSEGLIFMLASGCECPSM